MNIEGMKTSRVNIRMADRIKEWFECMALETGISRSSLMAMALAEYIDQKESIRAMTTMKQMYEELSGIELNKEDKKEILNNFAKEL